jgi:hypothetical protein
MIGVQTAQARIIDFEKWVAAFHGVLWKPDHPIAYAPCNPINADIRYISVMIQSLLRHRITSGLSNSSQR